MDSLERLDGFVRKAGALHDVAGLKVLISQETVRLGFERFAYVVLRQSRGASGRMYFGTYPSEWSQFYADRDLWLHDPIMRHPFRAMQPFLWDDVVRAERDRASEMLVFGPASDAGLRAGAAVPIHGPHGGVALLAVSKDCPEAAFQALFAARRYALQIVAYAAHDAVLRIVSAPSADRPVTLSPRQKEVLLWTIHGKTNWEIGEILRISEDTVRQHLRTVCRLLGANNRTHAAAIAVSRHLIAPDGGSSRAVFMT